MKRPHRLFMWLVAYLLSVQLGQAMIIRLNLPSIWIGRPRSLLKDTVLVSMASSGGSSVQAVNTTVTLGDFGKGTIDPVALQKPLSLEFVVQDDASQVDLAFIVVNTHQPNSDTIAGEQLLAPPSMAFLIVRAVLVKETLDVTLGFVGGPASLLAKTVDALFGVLPDCDGVVAVQNLTFTGDQIRSLHAGGPALRNTENYYGSDSPVGCGANSWYHVSWIVERLDVPSAASVMAQTTNIARSTAQRTMLADYTTAAVAQATLQTASAAATTAVASTPVASAPSTSAFSSAMSLNVSTIASASPSLTQPLPSSATSAAASPANTSTRSKSSGSAKMSYPSTVALLLFLLGLAASMFL